MMPRCKSVITKIKGLHFIAIILLNIVFWTGILSVNEDIIIERDFNFPASNDNFVKSFYPLWNDVSSQPNVERLARLVVYLPYLILAQMGLEISILLKVLIISTFTFLTIAMFLFCRSLLQHFKIEVKGQNWVSVGCAFVFAYTPVSLYFAQSISLLISLGALPLLLYFILTKMNSVYFPLLAVGALLLSAAHPFNLVMNIIIGSIFLLLVNMSRKELRFVLVKTTMTFLSFIVIYSWFLIPYLSNPTSSVELGRETGLSPSVFRAISDNDPVKIVLLERDQFRSVNTEPPDATRSTVHYASLVSLVGIGFSVFVKKPDWKMYRILLIFSAGFVICVLLSLGDSGPLGEIYYALISESSFGWIFRSPLKFQMYQSFFIIPLFAISITSVVIKKLQSHNLISVAGITIAFIFVGSSAFGIYNANISTFKPIDLPSEFFEINDMLNDNNGTAFKILYYPLYNERPTQWSQGHRIAPFEAKSTAVPTYDMYNNYNYVRETLYQYPYSNGLLASPGYYDFLASLGIKYIIFHDDKDPNRLDQANLIRLRASNDIRELYSKGSWYLFEVLRPISGTLNIVDSQTLVSQQSDIYKFSSPDQVVVLDSMQGGSSPSIDQNGTSETNSGNQSIQPQYQRLSATKVLSEVNSSSGSMLVFTETFDRGWKAYIGGQKVDSLPVNGMINGFPLNAEGEFLVSIEYEPQKWFEIGAIIATAYTISFVTLGLLRKHISQRISTLTNAIR
jgi:hypothetical protein